MRGLKQTVRQFAASLKRHFAQELADDPTRFRGQVLEIIRRELPFRRGRRNDPRIDAAWRMIQQGKSPRDVIRLQLPDFDQMDTYGRYLAEKGLRAAIARRRRACARVKVDTKFPRISASPKSR